MTEVSDQDQIRNPVGWRRLWPSKLWLQTVEESTGVWSWRIWSEDKGKVLAMSPEPYHRQADCARGAKRFGDVFLAQGRAPMAPPVTPTPPVAS